VGRETERTETCGEKEIEVFRWIDKEAQGKVLKEWIGILKYSVKVDMAINNQPASLSQK
jgi:hypothetical protein